MSPLTSMPALPSPVKRSACTARAVSTRARMVDDDSPPSSLDSLTKGTRRSGRVAYVRPRRNRTGRGTHNVTFFLRLSWV